MDGLPRGVGRLGNDLRGRNMYETCTSQRKIEGVNLGVFGAFAGGWPVGGLSMWAVCLWCYEENSPVPAGGWIVMTTLCM